MRYINNLALLVAFVFLCGFGGGQTGNGNSSGGAPTGVAGGDLGSSYPNPTVTGLTHAGGSTLDNVVIGGTTPVAGTFAALNATSAPALGAIGGTTSSTGQFTKLAVGASAPTLPTNVGDISIAGFIQLPSASTADCFAGTTPEICTASGRTSVQVGTGNKFSMDTPSVEIASVSATGLQIFAGTNGINLKNGTLIDSAGGALPTATCSGGSTGVVVESNTGCTGSTAPFPCCTGSGTGTCFASTNNRGALISSSSSSTTCTLTFSAAAAWPQAPVCIWQSDNASVAGLADGTTTTTTAVVNFTAGTSKIMDYMCM